MAKAEKEEESSDIMLSSSGDEAESPAKPTVPVAGKRPIPEAAATKPAEAKAKKVAEEAKKVAYIPSYPTGEACRRQEGGEEGRQKTR